MTFEYRIGEFAGNLELEIKPNERITGFLRNIDGWLVCDVQCFGEDYLTKIRTILNSEDPNSEELFWGNAYKAHVRKDFTTISYDFEYCNPKMVPCTLPTEMLCEILEIWIKAKAEHNAKVEAERKKK